MTFAQCGERPDRYIEPSRFDTMPSRRATDPQVLEDAERLIAAWNERQALRAPMIFSPTIGGALAVGKAYALKANGTN